MRLPDACERAPRTRTRRRVVPARRGRTLRVVGPPPCVLTPCGCAGFRAASGHFPINQRLPWLNPACSDPAHIHADSLSASAAYAPFRGRLVERAPTHWSVQPHVNAADTKEGLC